MEAANVDCEYIEEAYIDLPSDACDIDAPCLTKGAPLAFRLMFGNDGLCLDRRSKWPERFSFNECCNIDPESVFDRGVVGR